LRMTFEFFFDFRLFQAPSGRWYAVGLVSWGIDCGLAGIPGIYTRIAEYRDFIENA